MLSLKYLLILCAIVSVCYCDHHNKKKHKYELYWHGFHYLVFLAFKFKALLILGTIFSIGLLIGKFFAIIKIAEYMKKSHHDDYHHEKIMYMPPHGIGDDHPPIHDFSGGPGPSYGKSHQGGGGSFDSFPPGYSVDQPPPGAQLADMGGNFNGPGQMYGSGSSGNYAPIPNQSYGPPNGGYGRSNTIESYSIYEKVKRFKKLIEKFNITDVAFNNMNLKTDSCRRKFVCEADFKIKNSFLLKSVFDLFSDENYTKYRTKMNITSLNKCDELYPNCIEDR